MYHAKLLFKKRDSNKEAWKSLTHIRIFSVGTWCWLSLRWGFLYDPSWNRNWCLSRIFWEASGLTFPIPSFQNCMEVSYNLTVSSFFLEVSSRARAGSESKSHRGNSLSIWAEQRFCEMNGGAFPWFCGTYLWMIFFSVMISQIADYHLKYFGCYNWKCCGKKKEKEKEKRNCCRNKSKMPLFEPDRLFSLLWSWMNDIILIIQPLEFFEYQAK